MSNVRVAVRARPILPREDDINSPIVVDMVGSSTILFKSRAGVAVGQAKDASKEFVYDFSHWSAIPTDPHFVSQEKVFQDLGLEVLDAAFKGYNTCIFAYGQTGSGKTFTMMGNESSPGLIPRICKELFDRMNSGNRGQVSYKVDVSYMEIYNEKVRDLLQLSSGKDLQRKGDQLHSLKLREHPRDGPYVQDLSTHQVGDYTSILNLIHLGNKQRSTAFTKMNDLSSRSHAIFTITFKQARYSEDMPSETVSKINLVDLAGSERASQTGAEGQRLRESGSINKSLVCLGNVIQALAEMSAHHKRQHVPYRDSVLTWLLKDSLGGNSKTIMIATVSPCECSYGETLSTLRYASRAKNIVNKPVVNEDSNVKLIRELREEIRRLKEIVASGDINVVPPESSLRLAVDLRNKERKIAALTKYWAEKWDDIHQIIEERELALHSEGQSVRVASERPHLLGLDEEMFGAGVVLYYLKNGETTIGSEGREPLTDISLKADDIEPLHCAVQLTEDSTLLHSMQGTCHVNRVSVDPNIPTKLSHGDTLQLGSRTYLRFNHPQEAQKLKETSMQEADKSCVSDDSSYASPVWSAPSPLLTGSSYHQHQKLNELEQERNSLQQQQTQLVKDYEDRIQEMLEQLKKEEEGKAALQERLEQLQEKQMTASIRLLSFSASGEIKRPTITSTPTIVEEADRTTSQNSSPPTPLKYSITTSSPSPTSSKQSVASLSTREVMGEEHPDTPPRSPSPITSAVGEWVDCGKYYVPEKPDDSLDYQPHSVSLNDKRTYILAEDLANSGIKSSKSDENLALDESHLDFSLDLLDDMRSRTLSRLQEHDRMDRRRLRSRREKAILRKKLKDIEDENMKMRKDMCDLELKLQTDGERRRTYAFDEDSGDSPRVRPRFPSQSSSPVKISVFSSFLRGYGFSSYHVYEITIVINREKWRVYRKYQEFRIYHNEMSTLYPQLSQLTLPPSKWFGFKNEVFVSQRKIALERYLQSLVAILSSVPGSPFCSKDEPMTRKRLEASNRFFAPGLLEVDRQ